MLRLSAWIARWVVAAAALCLAWATVRAACSPLQNSHGWDRLLGSPALWAATAGMALRLLLTRWRRGDPLEFLDTLEHELTHAGIGTLTMAPPISLKATLRKGGEVELRRNNPLAALSPYFLPLYAALAALLTLALRPELLPAGRAAVGFLLGSYAYRLARELHLGQTDLREYGLPFSLVFIAAMLPLALAGILETARILDLDWVDGIGPAFLDQLRWLWAAGTGLRGS